MRMPRVRFTVRRMMVVIAIAGVALIQAPGFQARLQRRQLGLEVQAFAHGETIAWNAASVARGGGPGLSSERLVFHKRMVGKYQWAARYPWLPVLPDPPEPK
jgi:hypothetical protein